MRRFLISALILAAPTAALADPIGKWRVGEGTSHVEIAPCGQALCGTIVWLKDRNGRDENNPDKALRGRPLLGVEILKVEPAGAGKWTGTIYNARDGQTYTAKLTEKSKKLVRIEGCAPGAKICGEESWRRIK